MFSVALSLLLIFAVYRIQSVYENGRPARMTRVDIFADRIQYRTSTYQTPTQFAIGLKAVQDPPRVLGLHDCSRVGVMQEVIGILREQDVTSFEIELPENC